MIAGRSDSEIAKEFEYSPSAIWKRRQQMQMHSYLRLRSLLLDITNHELIMALDREIRR